MDKENTKKIIALGNVRVRLSNIKNYGISSQNFEFFVLQKYKFIKEKRNITKKRKVVCKALAYSSTLVTALVGIGVAMLEGENKGKGLATGMKVSEHVNDTLNGLLETEKVVGYEYIGDCMFIPSRNDVDKILSNNVDNDIYYEEKGIVEKKVDYLYITTYQKDNFIFREDLSTFDIYEKCKELDNYFS